MACRPCKHLKWVLSTVVSKACAHWQQRRRNLRVKAGILFCALPLQASQLGEVVLLCITRGQKVSLNHSSDGSGADTLACDTVQLECDSKEPKCWSELAPADVAHMPMIYLLQGPALGAAVAALGLSNKAVYAEQLQDSNGGVASGMEGGSYTDGPDLAPNAMPAAVSGELHTTKHMA